MYLTLCLPQVLHYLAVQKPADLARHLLPCVIHAAVLKVKEEGKCLIWLVISSFPKCKCILPKLFNDGFDLFKNRKSGKHFFSQEDYKADNIPLQ